MRKNHDVSLFEVWLKKDFMLGEQMVNGFPFDVSQEVLQTLCYSAWAPHFNKWLAIELNGGIDRIMKENYKTEISDWGLHLDGLQQPQLMLLWLDLFLQFKIGVGLEGGGWALVLHCCDIWTME
jgi:hypothetical protein